MGLAKLLIEIEDDLLRIKRRFFYLKCTIAELDKRTGEEYKIKNDIVYQLVSDSFDMLIIDLASLYRGMCQSGGFFGQLKQYSSSLKSKSHKKVEVPTPIIVNNPRIEESDVDIKKIQNEFKEERRREISDEIKVMLTELFPDLKKNSSMKANHDLINELKDRFFKDSEKLIADRDQKRAHKYEKKKKKVPVESMDIEGLHEEFERLEMLLTKIRVIALDSSFAFTDMSFANSKVVAEDLVDQILHGSINMHLLKIGLIDNLNSAGDEKVYYKKFRNDYYE